MGATLVLAAAAAAAGLSTAPRLEKQGSVYRLERGRTAYCFDAAWRVETLWVKDASDAWRRVSIPAPARVAEFRNVFLVRMNCAAVGDLPVEGKAEMKAVAALGYL